MSLLVRGATMIRGGILLGSRLRVFVLIISGGTLQVRLLLLLGLLLEDNVQRARSPVTALCRKLLLLALFAGMLEFMI